MPRALAAVRASPADRRLLPEGRLAGPMPWVIAILMFLTALACAGGLSLGGAAGALGAALGNRATVQIVVADPAMRDAQAAAAARALARIPGVRAVHPVAAAEMTRLLAPWLGPDALAQGLPIPALIDVDLAPGTGTAPLVRALGRIAPGARIDDQADVLAPLARLVTTLGWLALALVVLMAMATALAVVLAARAALDTHRTTIDVMHLLGATDVQIARLFQRRLALDALFGGVVGLAGALAVLLVIGRRVAAIGSELVGTVALPTIGWAVLAVLPLAAAALATWTARRTVLAALGRML